MEEQPSWVLKLSLEDMALRRVLVSLWSKTEILLMVQKFRLKLFNDSCKKRELLDIDLYGTHNMKIKGAIENKIKDDVLKLAIPETLKKRMLFLIRPIGSEILKWEFYHEKMFRSFCDFDVWILQKLCWTSFGVIDYRKTAEELIRLEMFRIHECYLLACEYCLVDYIPLLWEKLPRDTKNQICREGSFSLSRNKEIKVYWAYVLQGKESELDLDILKFAAINGNKTATEYFLPRFADAESKPYLLNTIFYILETLSRELIAFSSFPSEKLSDIICDFLSMLTPEQQMKVLKRRPLEVFVRCLEWPWQDFFLYVAGIIWTFRKSLYDEMLFRMAENINRSGYYFPDLFQKFFLRSPRNLKKLFVRDEYIVCSFFREFFHFEDAGTIKVVFRQLDAEDRVRLLSSYDFYKLLDGLIMRNKPHLVELCFQEASLTKKDRERLKKTFKRFSTWVRRRTRRRTHRLKQMFKFLNKIEPNTHGKKR